MGLLFLFLIATPFLSPGNGEVVDSFQHCSQFFLDRKLPDDNLRPQNSARICQVYKNKYRFATMYDRTNRIPIYSAYVYQPGEGERDNNWMIEPQLVDRDYDKNMEDERDSTIPPADIAASQATFNDYSTAPYYVDKGHLSPVVHHSDDDSKAATFTLTNIVPQYNRLNQGPWAEYETKTMAQMTAQYGCTKVYVMVGAVPGNTLISDRVNYPSHVWSAACCVIGANQRVSWGALASNDWNKPPNVSVYNLRKLEDQLAKLYDKGSIDIFKNSCYEP